MEAKLLMATIEDVRKKLVILFQQVGNFSDNQVVALSQELDQYIAEYQQLMIKNSEVNSETTGIHLQSTIVAAQWLHDREISEHYTTAI